MARQDIAARVQEAADTLELGPAAAPPGGPVRWPAPAQSRWAARWCGSRGYSCSTSRCPTSTPAARLDAVEIARLHRKLGTTMIYVTHDRVEAMTLGQRIVVFNGGRIEQIDTPMALYQRPASVFVATFLGSPAMNLLDGRLRREGGLALQPANGDPPIPLDPGSELPAEAFDRDIRLGVRPEHLLAANAGDAKPSPRKWKWWNRSAEAFVNLRHGRTALVARLACRRTARRRQPIAAAPVAPAPACVRCRSGRRL